MSDLNQVIITGRCTKNAESSYSSQGNCICHFTLANNDSKKDTSGQKVELPSFFDCFIFGKYAESMSKYLSKGKLISITGRLKQNRWEKDGQKQSRIQINVSEIYFLPSGSSKKDEPAPQDATPPQDEIPFDN